jgi:hypothetical protein
MLILPAEECKDPLALEFNTQTGKGGRFPKNKFKLHQLALSCH